MKRATAELKAMVLARGSTLMDLHGVGPRDVRCDLREVERDASGVARVGVGGRRPLGSPRCNHIRV